jgi:hypothetical protein
LTNFLQARFAELALHAVAVIDLILRVCQGTEAGMPQFNHMGVVVINIPVLPIPHPNPLSKNLSKRFEV